MLILICLRHVSIKYFSDFFIVNIYPIILNVLVNNDFVGYNIYAALFCVIYVYVYF